MAVPPKTPEVPDDVRLQTEDLELTDVHRAQVFWLLRRYTSSTYVQRLAELFGAFVDGYREYAERQPPKWTPWYRETLTEFTDYRASLAKGAELLGAGRPEGLHAIVTGVLFPSYLYSPRFEFGDGFDNMGYRRPPEPSLGLFSWAERASEMADRVRVTLGASTGFERKVWSWRELLKSAAHIPESLPAMPRTGRTVTVKSGNETPVAGIWEPIDAAGACPNYILAGIPAPRARVAEERTYNHPDYPYHYGYHETRWQLLWEDDRYRGRPVRAEPGFLDASNELPPYPPRAD